MNQIVKRLLLTGTPKTLVGLLLNEKGMITPPRPLTGVKNAIPIEISEKIDPGVFFDRFEAFIEAWWVMLSGMSGKDAVKEAEGITSITLAASTFYNRCKKYATDLDHLRHSYWGALSHLPFSADDDQFPVLIYHLRARPDLKRTEDRNSPYDFSGLCRRCLEGIFGQIYPDALYRWFCMNCGRRIEFEPNPLDWGRRKFATDAAGGKCG